MEVWLGRLGWELMVDWGGCEKRWMKFADRFWNNPSGGGLIWLIGSFRLAR
jgi:hypothetical protein